MSDPHHLTKNKKISPPLFATRLLRWYCRPQLLEDLEGDLNEYFERNVKTKGSKKARLIFVIDVFKFLRSYTVRRPDFLNFFIQWIMIGSYIKTSGRSVARNKLFSFINIAGLTMSMAVGLLMIAMLADLFSYDTFHENRDRIYRVISRYEHRGQKDDEFNATSSLNAAMAIKEFSEVEAVAILHYGFSGDVTSDGRTVSLTGFSANEALFKVFSFHLLQGDPSTALKEPFSVVLTQLSARKLFGDSDALGKTLNLGDREYTITGILKDIPTFSHIKFDILGSLSTREVTEKENTHEMAWDNMWSTWTYILPHQNDLTTIRSNLLRLSEKEDKTLNNTHIELALQPMAKIMTGEQLSNQIGPVMGSTTVWILGSLSIVLVLCACLNYTNLSIARAFRRSREVGIRKTIGASKSQVVNQFIIESVIIAFIALVFSLGCFLVLKPHFIGMEPSLTQLLTLSLSPKLVILFVLFALGVGISAGLFPAIFFANINSVNVLKNMPRVPIFKGLTARKALMVFQYSVSIIAITATLIFHKQYKHFIAFDLGFSTENILNIPLNGNKAELLKKELLELPEVKGISQSMLITSLGNFWGTSMKNPSYPLDSAGVHYNIIDENYLPLHEHKLLAGRNFTANPGKVEETEVIVNEQVLKRFKIAAENPALAIDEFVRVDGKDLKIIGVMKNFQYGRANNQPSRGVIMRYSNENPQYLNIKILSSDWPATHAKIETIWKKIDPVHPLHAKFYSEQIEEAFAGLKASVKVGAFLAFLVVCIATFGLLGMVVFTTEIRMKEISIRKVFGATEGGLLYLLSKGFIILLCVAGTISLPVTYLFFEKLLFPDLANHAPLEMTDLCIGFLTVMLVALFTIGSRTLRVARSNPSEVLKNE